MKFLHAAIAATMMTIPIAAHADADDASARIAAYDDAVIGVMKSKLGLAGRSDRFEGVVHEYYDMPVIAQIVVGPKWAASSAVDRDAAIAALTRHSAVTLARNFTAYQGEKFIIDPVVINRGASRIVKVTIVAPGSRNLLLFQLREGKGGWKIVDVIADGVSQLAVQRADVAAAVTAGGAAGLAKRLTKLDAVVR